MKVHSSLLALSVTAALVVPLPAQDELGQAMFAVCMACHGPDGKGMPNPAVPGKTMAPPLAGSKLATGDPAVFAAIILKGIKKETEDYPQVMAPLPLPAPQLTAVMNYVRTNFGNNASKVTEADVSAFVEKWQEIKEPISRAKLDEMEKAAAAPKE